MSKWFIHFNTLHDSMDKRYTVFYIDKLIRRKSGLRMSSDVHVTQTRQWFWELLRYGAMFLGSTYVNH